MDIYTVALRVISAAYRMTIAQRVTSGVPKVVSRVQRMTSVA
jgi:hypothetical protein